MFRLPSPSDASSTEKYKASKEPYFSSAPEVAPQSTPERANQDYEGPELANHPGQHGSARPHYGSGGVVERKAVPPKSSKKLVILAIIGAVITLAVGIGIGVGIGMSVEKSSSDSGKTTKKGAQPGNSPTTTSLSPSSSSAAPEAQATGSTSGLALYSCTNGTQISSSSDVIYITDCQAAYLTGGTDLYHSGSIIANVSEPPYTRYNLDDCLDMCDRWNWYPDHDDIPCRTVTYYANLTQAYGDNWMGNCFLKSGRPADIARSGDAGIDWEHTVSAYMSCLVNGSC